MHYTSHNLPDPAAPQAAVTVFCAVWHKQPDKEALLRGHWENLKAQTLPVETCYIFDNGDQAPDWLDATWHSFSEPLSIYEAWSAGISLARTRYVMNLNMDDRLARNAVRLLAGAAQSANAALAGGEWEVRFDRAHLGQQFDAEDLWETQFKPDWPPLELPRQRLGSGTGERGTYGPATLWNREELGDWYPSYFGNGEPVRSFGDAVYWAVLKKKNVRLERLPVIIGRYLSEAGSQAEFRPNRDNELLAAHGLSPVCFGSLLEGGKVKPRPGQAEPQPAASEAPLTKAGRTARDLEDRYRRLMGLPPRAGAQRPAA